MAKRFFKVCMNNGKVPEGWRISLVVPIEVNMDLGRIREMFRGGRGWRLPGLLYAYDMVLCGESEENLSDEIHTRVRM